MSDPTVDKAIFGFLASCVGDFVRWSQCMSVGLQGDNDGGCLSGVLFKARATNPADRTGFKILVMKNSKWWVRVIQVSNHVLLDERATDRDTIVNAVNHFMELAGMAEKGES